MSSALATLVSVAAESVGPVGDQGQAALVVGQEDSAAVVPDSSYRLKSGNWNNQIHLAAPNPLDRSYSSRHFQRIGTDSRHPR